MIGRYKFYLMGFKQELPELVRVVKGLSPHQLNLPMAKNNEQRTAMFTAPKRKEARRFGETSCFLSLR